MLNVLGKKMMSLLVSQSSISMPMFEDKNMKGRMQKNYAKTEKQEFNKIFLMKKTFRESGGPQN